MSGEQAIQDQSSNARLKTVRTRERIHHRVDINVLMAKVRNEKKKQSKENLVFFGLISSVVIIVGVIASL